MKTQRGFTMIEMTIAIILIGVVTIIVAPLLGELASSQNTAYRTRQITLNRKIAKAMIEYAKRVSPTGSLPMFYSNNSDLFAAPLNPSDNAQSNVYQMNGVPLEEANDDNRAAHLLRIFQRIGGLTQTVPLSRRSGPQVTITFEYGAVYNTTCSKGASCDKNAPDVSALMTSSNYGTWQPTPPDFGASYVSSWPVQMAMLADTDKLAQALQDAFSRYFDAQQAANPGSTANFYPNNGASTVASASSNQGCWYSWMSLNNSSLLDTVGLNRTMGVTAWGGNIEYCRDFDATGSSSPDAAPHYAAIRFNNNVSAGSAPDASIASNNVILSF
ncbi:type II secretion system protein [Noviherbaspirillum pedocola]|uniref:Type II secretion system protein n=1 Tax=Noviherbaspirillum pedocola TaxID=2801341 RepID=A0A934W4P1_9BURK|nr:type II secretion system protein [Noviherbaspirillum pedocola]MBK4738746.1 type II secretion system protein [Noviherbaspirillum pedocola]